MTLSASVLLMAWLMEQGRINAPVAALGILLALSALEPFAALRRGAEQAGRTWLALRRLAPALMAKAEAAESPQQPMQKLAVSLQSVRLRQLGPST
jgi:ATP-binding cassette subfamily C protein CydC